MSDRPYMCMAGEFFDGTCAGVGALLLSEAAPFLLRKTSHISEPFKHGQETQQKNQRWKIT